MKASDQELYVTLLTDLIAKISAFIESELQEFIEQSKIYQSSAISEEGYKMLNNLHRKLKRVTDEATSLIGQLRLLTIENKEVHNQENFLYLLRQKTKVLEADARSCIKEARNIMRPITGLTISETELLDLQSRYNKLLEQEKYIWTFSSNSLLGSEFKKMTEKLQKLESMYRHITKESNQKIQIISAEKTSLGIKIEKKVQAYKVAINELESFDKVYQQFKNEFDERINNGNDIKKQISDYSSAIKLRKNYIKLAKKCLGELGNYKKEFKKYPTLIPSETLSMFFDTNKHAVDEIGNNISVNIDSKDYMLHDKMTKYRLATESCNSDIEKLKLLIEIMHDKSQSYKEIIEKEHEETKNIQNNRLKELISQIDKINTSFSALFAENLVQFEKEDLEADTLYEKASVFNELYNKQALSIQEHDNKLKKLVQYTNSFIQYAQNKITEPLNNKLHQLEDGIKPKLSELRKNILSSSLSEEGKNILLTRLDKLIIPPATSSLSNREVLIDTISQLEVSSKAIMGIQEILTCINDKFKSFSTLFKSIGSQEEKVTFLHALSEAAPNLHNLFYNQIEGDLVEFAKDDISIIIDYFRESSSLPNSLKNKLAFIEIAIAKNLGYADILKEGKHHVIKAVNLLAESGLNHAITEQLIENPIFCDAVITLNQWDMLNEHTIIPLQEDPNRWTLIKFYIETLQPKIAAPVWNKLVTGAVEHFLNLDSGTVNLLRQLKESLKEPTASKLLQPWFLCFANANPTLSAILNSQPSTALSANANFLIDILDKAEVVNNMYTVQYLTDEDSGWAKNRIMMYFEQKEASLANLLALNQDPDRLHQMLAVRNQINQALMKLEEKYADKRDASASFTNFKNKMLPILLAPGNNEDKKGQLLNLAHHEFKHRHAISRILDDIIHIINRIFGSGIKFFSSPKTKREIEVGKTISESLKPTPPAA